MIERKKDLKRENEPFICMLLEHSGVRQDENAAMGR
jgi:hypothetical protein